MPSAASGLLMLHIRILRDARPTVTGALQPGAHTAASTSPPSASARAAPSRSAARKRLGSKLPPAGTAARVAPDAPRRAGPAALRRRVLDDGGVGAAERSAARAGAAAGAESIADPSSRPPATPTTPVTRNPRRPALSIRPP